MSRDGIEVAVTVQQVDASLVELGALKLVVLGRLKNSARKDGTDSPVVLMEFVAQFVHLQVAFPTFFFQPL